MGNLFYDLPMPAGNGVGASVDVSGMGGAKTIIVSGSFAGAAITVEVSVDGGTEFAPLVTFQNGATRIEKAFAATHMRVRVGGRSSRVPFSANVDVGADDAGTEVATIAIPADNGSGAAVDVSLLGLLNTVIVSGTFPGAAVLIEATEDGSAWAPLCQFSGKGGMWTGEVTGFQMRATVSGRNSQAPFTNVTAAVAAANTSGGGGAGSGGDRGWYGTAIDGDYVGAGDHTQSRDMYYGDMLIHAGETYCTNGFKLAVAGTLTIEEGGVLHNNGISYLGGPAGTLLGGADGGYYPVQAEIARAGVDGGSPSWWPVAASPPGSGGAGGTTTSLDFPFPVVGGGSGGTPNLGYGAGPYTIEQIASGDGVCGGAGGGSGGTNGNPSSSIGGGGGGVMVIKARYFDVPDNAIQCKGGDGSANGTAGGGGGGQGGVILIITDDATAPVCDVSGGAGSAASGVGGTAGADGDDGVVIAISPIHGPL